MGPVVLADLLAVAHGVAPRLGQCRKVVGSRCAGVFRPVGPYLVDVALPGRELLLQKNRQVDLADEADALRILAPGRSQVLLFGDAPHFGLGKPPDGEKRPRQLLLRQLAEEIALILVAVDTRQQAVMLRAVGRRDALPPAIVSRRHEIGPQPQRLLQENVELDLAVAQHVGIGRAPPFVLGEHVIDHPPPVLLREVDDVEGNVEPPGDQLGEHAVVVPRAVAFERTRRIVPVNHEEAHHLVALLFEQVSCHRGVDAPRKSYDNALHGLHFEFFSRSATAAPRAASSAGAGPRNRSPQ